MQISNTSRDIREDGAISWRRGEWVQREEGGKSELGVNDHWVSWPNLPCSDWTRASCVMMHPKMKACGWWLYSLWRRVRSVEGGLNQVLIESWDRRSIVEAKCFFLVAQFYFLHQPSVCVLCAGMWVCLFICDFAGMLCKIPLSNWGFVHVSARARPNSCLLRLLWNRAAWQEHMWANGQ